MLSQRSAGILLHPTSLPSLGGIGDLGPEAYAFADFLCAFRPAAVAGASAFAAGAGQFTLFSHFRFCRQPAADQPGTPGASAAGWTKQRLKKPPPPRARIDFDEVKAYKMPLLQQAAQNFLDTRQWRPGALCRHSNATMRGGWKILCSLT